MPASTKKSRWGDPMRHSLNELEAFDAMRAFLDAYWRRGKCASDDIAVLLGSINRYVWADFGPGDPAQLEDWLDAIAAIKTPAAPGSQA
jgi:hypothetical protein